MAIIETFADKQLLNEVERRLSDITSFDTEAIARELVVRLKENIGWNEDTDTEFGMLGSDLDNMEVALLTALQGWIDEGQF